MGENPTIFEYFFLTSNFKHFTVWENFLLNKNFLEKNLPNEMFLKQIL